MNVAKIIRSTRLVKRDPTSRQRRTESPFPPPSRVPPTRAATMGAQLTLPHGARNRIPYLREERRHRGNPRPLALPSVEANLTNYGRCRPEFQFLNQVLHSIVLRHSGPDECSNIIELSSGHSVPQRSTVPSAESEGDRNYWSVVHSNY